MTLFALPPGADFAAELIAGLDDRHPDPAQLARVTLIVNTRRMERRLTDLYAAGPARLLPRIVVVTDLPPPPGVPPLPVATSPLRRRLDIAGLVAQLIAADPTLAPRASVYDLADSLITLMDEMEGEGVTAADIAALDVSDQSGHWARAQQFFGIVAQYLAATGAPGGETRQVAAVDALLDHWQAHAPAAPVYVAGSTGSRGATHRLMTAVALMPGCGVILPGFDRHLPAHVWKVLRNPLKGEDHPQFRYARLMASVGASPADVEPWTEAPEPSPMRNALLSLALRPAPVTDQWRREGPDLGALGAALDDVTLVEAPTPRDEALTIALRLRDAAERGQTAALISPDRMLTRRVTAALDRWGIVPDDSAGTPLHLSPPGRFLRHVAALDQGPLTVEALLTLLKHPLTHSCTGRNRHNLLTRDLELHLRRNEIVYPDGPTLRDFADGKGAAGWGRWLRALLLEDPALPEAPLESWVARLLSRAEALAGGPLAEDSELWRAAAGRKARALADTLTKEAPHGDVMAASDFASLLHALLSREEVRDRDAAHPGILIWGTLEARAQAAPMVILGGLNEGAWPGAPKPDPWLNRVLRHRAGLLLPDRQIGLSAHDFQIAAAAPEVWLTRALKSDDAETVPSRWLNRLGNMLTGLPGQGGDRAWQAARDRGKVWMDKAALLDAAPRVDPAPRPAPSPPVDVRPRAFYVTDIPRLRRDPYAIYARDVLRLRPLNPVTRAPDARLRGTLLHKAVETFVRASLATGDLSAEALLAHTRRALAAGTPWPQARVLWLAKLARIADAFARDEAARQARAMPSAFETSGRIELPALGVTLTGRADRIDLTDDGAAILYDYKTGTPPKEKQQLAFDRQLLLEAAMVARGAFDEIGGKRPVADAIYLGLGSGAPVQRAPLGDGDGQETPDQVWDKLHSFLTRIYAPDHGFTSRRATFETRFEGDYDHLARFGEWDHGSKAQREDVT